jgi:hypothetical protein
MTDERLAALQRTKNQDLAVEEADITAFPSGRRLCEHVKVRAIVTACPENPAATQAT